MNRSPQATVASAVEPGRGSHPLRVPLIVACAFFMEHLDSTVIATALPQMAKTFGEAPIALNAGVTVYMLTLAVFIPVSAWFADRFGARNVFAAAIVVFTGASILCGISGSLPQFLVARMIQGLGGAMMVPVGRIVVLRSTAKKDLMRAMAFLTWPALVGPIIGPSVGGFIATYWSWRWIFYMNVPTGVLGVFLVIRYVKNLRASTPTPFDRVGFMLSSIALVGLMSGLGLLADRSPRWQLTSALLAAAAVTGWATVRHMRTITHPLIDLRPFRVVTFTATSLGGSLSRFAVSSSLFVLPLMFQLGFGMSPFASGLLLLVGAVGSLSTKAIAIAVVRRFGFRRVLIINSLLIGAAVLGCASLTQSTPVTWMVFIMVACGFTRSLQFTCTNTLGFADMPPDRISAASMLTSMLQQIVMGIGVAFAATALQLVAALQGRGGGMLLASDFKIVLAAIGVFGMLGAIRFAGLDPTAGSEVSGRTV